MPRTSRSVAQRLASQSKSRKRRPRTPLAPSSPALDQALKDDVVSGAESSVSAPSAAAVPDAAAAEIAATRTIRTADATRRPGASAPARPSSARPTAARTPSKPAAPRRRYFEYAAEYAYVASDLRRIALVAAVLIALLVALSFIIQ